MEKSVVSLDDPDCLPATLLRELQSCDRHFAATSVIDSVQHEPAVSNVIDRINEYCQNNMVVGYHFTRAVRADIEASGLQPRTGDAIRESFLSRFGTRFSAEQLSQIRESWTKCYTPQMQKVRDNRIWFNFTRKALDDSGADLLLRFYGGEQVYFYINELPGVGEVLSSIGEPFIVRCALAPSEAHTIIGRPWGQIAASSYHRKVNPHAYQVDQDGYQFSDVPAGCIELLRIEP
ncbi:MAG TPA: hypothetical protein VFJ87_01055 [Rhodanobacteraceae bacterium]|jgi:hypothetical protein|nr:hypothetical protein [Rhodanobacteraceae bacterium]